MPFTTIDPVTALVVVDLQRGIVSIPLAHDTGAIIERSVRLADEFRRRGLPVVLVNVDGQPPGRTDAGPTALEFPPDFAVLVDELDAQPDDLLVTKQARSAFADTGLLERLKERGVTQVVVVGIATSAGVESTARDAHEGGLHVSLPLDAMGDRSAEAHEHSRTEVFPRIAETGTTDELLGLLAEGR